MSPRPGVAGVDTGGTFTDAFSDEGRAIKVLSNPEDPSDAVVEALRELERGAGEVAEGRRTRGAGAGGPATRRAPDLAVLAHGTTVATNALLERKGATTALVTNEGFADLIEIARQDRPSLYDLWADRPEPLVPRELRLEVSCRTGPHGEELAALDPEQVPTPPSGVEAVAICLLHADLDGAHERAVHERISHLRPDLVVSRSSAVAPEFREYERTVTTAINSYLGPPCARYLRGLAPLAGQVYVMTSAGGLVPLDEGMERPAWLLLSGPAAGVAAGAAAAAAAGFPDAVTFDMGGTSTDVCLVRDGSPEPAAQRTVAGFPVRLPSLDIHTIGAGGGSIAELDPGGALAVGPRSAGARPGPACYGRGAMAATVTDADVVAGRIPAGAFLPGIGPLDRGAAERALGEAGVGAQDVIAVVDESMVQAVRVVTVEKGVDPRELALVAFGGAGPLHACALADALEMKAVVVPPRAGVLSAVGLACSAPQVELVRSWPRGPWTEDELGAAAGDLAAGAREILEGFPTRPESVETSVDCRYAGQSHELRVPRPAQFHAEHERRNGFSRPEAQVEVVALRARAIGRPLVRFEELPPTPGRAPATGPVALAEADCTIWLPAGWRGDPTPDGSLVLTR